MSRVSKQQVPPNGWQFQQGDIWIQGETAEDLIQHVRSHRIANSLPEGDPWQEIQDQLCARFSTICLDSSENSPFRPMTSAFDRFKSFSAALASYVSSGGTLVDQNTANIRGEICAGCHANVASEEARPGSCASCRKVEDVAITALRKQILKGLNTPHDPKLKACGICGCDIKLKIWFDRKTLGVSEQNENAYPSFCWLKKD